MRCPPTPVPLCLGLCLQKPWLLLPPGGVLRQHMQRDLHNLVQGHRAQASWKVQTPANLFMGQRTKLRSRGPDSEVQEKAYRERGHMA